MMMHTRDKRAALVHQLVHIIQPTGIGPFAFKEKFSTWQASQPPDRLLAYDEAGRIVID